MATDQHVRLTVEGKARLEDELRHLTEVRLPDLDTRIHDASEHGDISDNAEFEDLKGERVRLDERVRDLEFLLARAEIISEGTTPDGEIVLGTIVTLLDPEGAEETWRLVSPEEAHTLDGSISTESPVGRALMGRKVGESPVVSTPGGDVMYKIVKVA